MTQERLAQRRLVKSKSGRGAKIPRLRETSRKRHRKKDIQGIESAFKRAKKAFMGGLFSGKRVVKTTSESSRRKKADKQKARRKGIKQKL